MQPLQALRSHRRLTRALVALLLASGLFSIPSVSLRLTQAVGTLTNQQNLSSASAYDEWPQIDANGNRVTTVWTQRDDCDARKGQLGYASTTDGADFPGASVQSVGLCSNYQTADVALQSDGTAHIAFPAGKLIRYRRRTASGTIFDATVTRTADSLPNAARIARGGDGRLWVVWRSEDGSQILYKTSTDNGANWFNGSDGGIVASESGDSRAPDITVDQNNNPHVFWWKATGSSKGEIRYADWNGSSFTTGSVTNDGSTLLDADPSATVDASNVIHVAWRKQIGRDAGESWQIFTATRAASGGTWANYHAVATVSGNAGYGPAIATDPSNNVYVTYSEPLGGNTRHLVFVTEIGGVIARGPDLPYRRFANHSALAISTQNGVAAHIAYQDDFTSNNGEILYARVLIGSGGGGVSARPVLDGGKTSTNANPIPLSFTNVSGDPDGVRWNWGSAPTDGDNDSGGWKTFGSQSIAPPAGIDTSSACQQLTLYTQVRKGADRVQSAGSLTPATIKYDADVQGTVQGLNPFLSSLPPVYSQGVGIAAADPGIRAGDPGFTRLPLFALNIDAEADCSGLLSFKTPYIPTQPLNGGTSYFKTLSFGGVSLAPGPVSFDVLVIDTLGNSLNKRISLVYDPADTDTTGTQPNTKGLPTVGGGAVTGDGQQNIIQTLTFSNVNVADNFYRPNNPGSQFWGVWIANSTDGQMPADDSDRWFPVQVPTPGSGFSLKWNVMSGLNFSDPANHPGQYTVFVRFLDGAGNPSARETAIKTTVQLNAGYKIPTLQVPLVQK